MAQKVFARFRDFTGDFYVNAQNANFWMSRKGDMLKLKGRTAVDRHGNSQQVFMKTGMER
jgi:hypothetical protein